MAELAIVRHVKSSSEAGLGKLCGLWRRGEQGREIQVTQQCDNAGKRQGAAARMVTFCGSRQTAQKGGSPELISVKRLLISTPFLSGSVERKTMSVAHSLWDFASGEAVGAQV